MSLNISGTENFSSQINNASLYNALLDSNYKLSKFETNNATAHINDCIQNSTIGLLARKKTETNNYPIMKDTNISILRSSNGYSSARTEFIDSFISNYPKTGKARMFLIDNNYIVLDKVKKITKDIKHKIFKRFGI